MFRKQVIFVGFVIILLTGLSNVCGQEKNAELKDKRITIQIVNKPLVTVFTRLMYKYDIAIGFEESTLDKDHNDYEFETNVPSADQKHAWSDKELISNNQKIENHLITVDFKDASLKDVMNEIVKQMKNYTWEINNDVVNIFPIRGRNPKFVKLLNLTFSEFIVPKDRVVGEIQAIIQFHRGFRAFLAENDLHIYTVRDSANRFFHKPVPETMKFTNLTLKELLNAITKSKRGGWILQSDKHIKLQDDNKTKDKEFIDILI